MYIKLVCDTLKWEKVSKSSKIGKNKEQIVNMDENEFKDRLFDVLNDTDNLPIQDIVVDDQSNIVNIYLTDGTRFLLYVKKCGK